MLRPIFEQFDFNLLIVLCRCGGDETADGVDCLALLANDLTHVPLTDPNFKQ
jgi:hypothetical protein